MIRAGPVIMFAVMLLLVAPTSAVPADDAKVKERMSQVERARWCRRRGAQRQAILHDPVLELTRTRDTMKKRLMTSIIGACAGAGAIYDIYNDSKD